VPGSPLPPRRDPDQQAPIEADDEPERWPSRNGLRPVNGRPPAQAKPQPKAREGFENGWFSKPAEFGGTRPPSSDGPVRGRPPVTGFFNGSANGGRAGGPANGQVTGRVNGQGVGPVNGRSNGRVDPRINDRLAGSRGGMPPVAPPRPAAPPPAAPPPVDPPTMRNLDALKNVEQFDQQRFDAGMTDPGPFGRMAFETRPPQRPVRPPSTDDDRPFDLKPPVKPPAADGEPDGDSAPTPKPKSRRKLPFWIELPVLVVVALLLTFTIQTFVARVYVIPSGSMQQTLNGNNGSGDRILVDKVVYDFHGPRPGDVVVFNGPAGWDQTEFFVNNSSNPVTHWLHQIASSIGLAKPDEYDLVKRVIAVGGQTIACCDSQNRILVNGKPLDEPYVYWQPDRGGPAQQLRFGPVTVPQGDLWMMGDNRNNSDDSRFQNGGGIHGVVPVANVIGKARTIIWPPSRWRGVGDHNPQAAAGIAAGAPSWFGSVPATGIGVLASLPTLWFGRRFSKRLRIGAGIAKPRVESYPQPRPNQFAPKPKID
jgi:signal peptidase I